MAISFHIRVEDLQNPQPDRWLVASGTTVSLVGKAFLDGWDSPRLLAGEGFGLALERRDFSLLLLIEGLHSTAGDRLGELVVAGLAIVGDDEDEQLLRRLCVFALRDLADFERAIGSWVPPSSSGVWGFEAAENLTEQLAVAGRSVADLQPDSRAAIAHLDDTHRSDLADDLATHRLPHRPGPLVVVTSSIERAAEVETRAWRGLVPSGAGISENRPLRAEPERTEPPESQRLPPLPPQRRSPDRAQSNQESRRPRPLFRPPARSAYVIPWISSPTPEGTSDATMPGDDDGDGASLSLTFSRIYIQTAGVGRRQDYQWVDAHSSPPDSIPSTLVNVPQLTDLVQATRPSLILGRSAGRPFLQMNSLKTRPERIDSFERWLVINLALAGPAACEPILRGLAVHALRDRERFEQVVSQLLPLESGSALGWTVVEDFAGRLSSAAAEVAEQDPEVDRPYLVALNTSEMWQALASELTTSSLPARDGPLVVVTECVSAEKLAGAGVWRGLTTAESECLEPDESAALSPPPPRYDDEDDALTNVWRANLPPAPPQNALQRWVDKTRRWFADRDR